MSTWFSLAGLPAYPRKHQQVGWVSAQQRFLNLKPTACNNLSQVLWGSTKEESSVKRQTWQSPGSSRHEFREPTLSSLTNIWLFWNVLHWQPILAEEAECLPGLSWLQQVFTGLPPAGLTFQNGIQASSFLRYVQDTIKTHALTCYEILWSCVT